MSSAISSSANPSYSFVAPIPSIKTPCRRWHALTTRTSCPTLPFYYGVLATRVYCRPTCTARLARRANIVYSASAQAAQTAGYRACKRCRPDDELFFGEAEEVVMKAMVVIGKRQGKEKGGLAQMAAEVGVTKSYLCRVFKKTMGMTVGEYIKEFETEERGNVLVSLSVSEVAERSTKSLAMHEIRAEGVDACQDVPIFGHDTRPEMYEGYGQGAQLLEQGI